MVRFLSFGWKSNRESGDRSMGYHRPSRFPRSPQPDRKTAANGDEGGKSGGSPAESTAEDPVKYVKGHGRTRSGRRFGPQRRERRGRKQVRGERPLGTWREIGQGERRGRRRNQHLVGHHYPRVPRAGADGSGILRGRGDAVRRLLLAAGGCGFGLRGVHGAATDRISDQQDHEEGGDGAGHHVRYVP